MSKFRVVTPKGASFTIAGGGYAYEKEALDPIDAEIVEAPANEAEFVAAARTADAIYAKGMPITKTIIDALENCRVITLGTVGVDSVDVKAATARGIPVTNVTTMTRPVQAIADTIEARDAKRFAKAVGELTEGCNACHQSMGRGYIVMRVPTEQPFSNQLFPPQGKQ